MSMALTKKVVTKGSINVNQGQCAKIANRNAAVEIKNSIHIKPLFFVPSAIAKNFYKNKGTVLH
ncbi:hypothetical protein A8C56_10250 [Niabella ginsenosidivorans]|uniref:Uncharacterized protein n=1 Tax=Niabella ginsenosidivorans TaxID=1176587 RepID=A0A1A9I3P2_9BACT|nr:hypothetical protein A8C56_10250 [Niabella ginsenosidivorans]